MQSKQHGALGPSSCLFCWPFFSFFLSWPRFSVSDDHLRVSSFPLSIQAARFLPPPMSFSSSSSSSSCIWCCLVLPSIPCPFVKGFSQMINEKSVFPPILQTFLNLLLLLGRKKRTDEIFMKVVMSQVGSLSCFLLLLLFSLSLTHTLEQKKLLRPVH